MTDPIDTPHFIKVATWNAAVEHLSFVPSAPRHTAGHTLESINIFVRDHKGREMPIGDRTIEAHYGEFVVTQHRATDEAEARTQALDTSYGADARAIEIAGNPGRSYALGPEVPGDDIDGRSPAVVVWADGNIFCFVASGALPAETLEEIAASMYDG